MTAPPAWVGVLHRQAFHYAVPIIIGRPPAPPEEPRVVGGTAVAVQPPSMKHGFLLTAGHVVAGALKKIEKDPVVECLAGPVVLHSAPEGVDLRSRALMTCRPPPGSSVKPYDLATIQLTEAEIAALEAAEHWIVRPRQWPPAPDLRAREWIGIAGYPGGTGRRQISTHELELMRMSLAGPITSVFQDHFSFEMDPAIVETKSYGVEDEIRPDLGGMSGAPAFLVRNSALVLQADQLCGIVCEGEDLAGGAGHDVFSCARLDIVRADGMFDVRSTTDPWEAEPLREEE